MLSLLYIDINWSGNFREGLTREIRENKTTAKISARTVLSIRYDKGKVPLHGKQSIDKPLMEQFSKEVKIDKLPD